MQLWLQQQQQKQLKNAKVNNASKINNFMNFASVALSSALQRELHATCTVQRAACCRVSAPVCGE